MVEAAAMYLCAGSGLLYLVVVFSAACCLSLVVVCTLTRGRGGRVHDLVCIRVHSVLVYGNGGYCPDFNGAGGFCCKYKDLGCLCAVDCCV